MGLKDLFNNLSGKKQKEFDDVLYIKPTELNVGYIFEYDLKSWKVQESYSYDWGDNFFSFEHKITDGQNTFYLSVEDDDELELILFDKIKFSALKEDFRDGIRSDNGPLNKLTVDNETFFFEEESPGYYKGNRDDEDDEWTELISWTYYNENGDKCLSIEQWDENSFELSLGKVLKAHEISNIIPAEIS